MGRIIADKLEVMKSDNNSLNSSIAKLESATKQACAQMDAMHSMWEGMAHSVFMSQFNKDRRRMEQMIKELKAFHEELEFTRTEFGKCETDVSQMIHSI